MKDEALNLVGFMMERLGIRMPSAIVGKDIADHVSALCRLTDDRYAEKNPLSAKTRVVKPGESGSPRAQLAEAIGRRFCKFRRQGERRRANGSGETQPGRAQETLSGNAIMRLPEEQLSLEEEVAVLVEDVYELIADEGRLLPATPPIRDPLDVLMASLDPFQRRK
jgi:hypothetical protein